MIGSVLAFFLVWLVAPGAAQVDPLTKPYSADVCPSCAGWNAPQRPVHLFGNTYYVGTRGLASVLIASPEGHVIIDGGLPDTAPLILANVRALGFDPGEVQLILNSHAHHDHSGGIAALQRATGAKVAASPASAPVIKTGKPSAAEPQHGLLFDTPPVPDVDVVRDGQTLQAGSINVTAHLTGGHSPGGTSWSWRACEGERCLTFVYADSVTPVSADGYLYSQHPDVVSDFERAHTVLEKLPCDVLLTPHPGASNLWDRVKSLPDGLVNTDACKRYAANARQALQERLAREARGGQ